MKKTDIKELEKTWKELNQAFEKFIKTTDERIKDLKRKAEVIEKFYQKVADDYDRYEKDEERRILSGEY